jgi:hypothetical protein
MASHHREVSARAKLLEILKFCAENVAIQQQFWVIAFGILLWTAILDFSWIALLQITGVKIGKKLK